MSNVAGIVQENYEKSAGNFFAPYLGLLYRNDKLVILFQTMLHEPVYPGYVDDDEDLAAYSYYDYHVAEYMVDEIGVSLRVKNYPELELDIDRSDYITMYLRGAEGENLYYCDMLEDRSYNFRKEDVRYITAALDAVRMLNAESGVVTLWNFCSSESGLIC